VTFDRSPRPFAFLISTPGGPAGYEVLEALTPAIERLGTWRIISHPESSLPYIAAEAEAAGYRPVHLAVGQAQGLYLTPALPTVLVPLWDYPDIPTTDLHRNGRMNWARVAGCVDLILSPSTFTAAAFRKAGVTTPIEFFPIPPRQGWSGLATWGPGLPVSLHVPHVIWGGVRENPSTQATEPRVPDADRLSLPLSRSRRLLNMSRGPLRRIKPYLSNATLQKLDGYKQQVLPILRDPNPIRLLGGITSAGYRRFVGRWVSDEAHLKLRGFKNRLRGRPQVRDVPFISQGMPASHLTLSGLAYSTVIDYSDPTINDVELISAVLHAFRDRPEVTLLVRLVSTPIQEAFDLERLARACMAPGLGYLCRVVVVAGAISTHDSIVLGRATSYYVEASRTRGWSMRLTEALASGRPAIAPRHSVFADWMNDRVGYPIDSDNEPTFWPIDAEARHTTSWNRVVWADLRDRLVESAEVAERHSRLYECLSASARQELAEKTSPERVVKALRSALERLPARPAGAFSWV